VPEWTTSPPCSPAPGPMSTTWSADGDGVLVVLDDEHRVAEVAQADEGVDEAAVVALVQADGGLVEHVEHADEARADLGGEADALGLSPGQGAGRAGQRQVVEADVEQEAQRALISLTTRSAISLSRSDSSRPRAPRPPRRSTVAMSAMLCPST
jgi:hypothetical protein